jgi:hypothetical protein
VLTIHVKDPQDRPMRRASGNYNGAMIPISVVLDALAMRVTVGQRTAAKAAAAGNAETAMLVDAAFRLLP